MSIKNISDKDIEIIKKLLGEEVGEEFEKFVNAKREEENKRVRNKVVPRKVKRLTVDVRKFYERDLVGRWDYDESYIDDEAYFEPTWFKKLKDICDDNSENCYEVVFVGGEHASKEVYEKLKHFQETGYLDRGITLPENARFGKLELKPRIISEKEKIENRRRRRHNKRYERRKDEMTDNSWFDYNEYDVLR